MWSLTWFIFQFLISLRDTSVNVSKDMFRIHMTPANVRPGKVILHFSLLINLMWGNYHLIGPAWQLLSIIQGESKLLLKSLKVQQRTENRVFDIQIFYFVKSYIYNDVSKCSQQWDVLRHYITIILSDLLVLSIFILRQEWFFGLMSEKRKSTSKKYLILNGAEVNNVLWFNKMLADSPVTCKLGSSIIQPSHYCFKTIN